MKVPPLEHMSERAHWKVSRHDTIDDTHLRQLDGKLPFPEVLLKSFEDHRRYLQPAPGGQP